MKKGQQLSHSQGGHLSVVGKGTRKGMVKALGIFNFASTLGVLPEGYLVLHNDQEHLSKHGLVLSRFWKVSLVILEQTSKQNSVVFVSFQRHQSSTNQ